MTNSIITNVDSYKSGMALMYPDNTTGVYSYIESRGGIYFNTVFFGLQAYLKKYLSVPITLEDIDRAENLFNLHGVPFYRENWEYILEKHDGYLPLRVRAVPEGSVVPVKNVLATIENTDPNCYWLTTWVETSLLRAIWYPTTVATQSWSIKQLIKQYLEETGEPSSIDFKLHDFGSRGVSSLESSEIGGAAHLVNFMGTDNVSSLFFVSEFYGCDIAGYSVPAAEHSVITAWGKDNEVEAYRNMLKQFAKPGSIVSVVSDSYDIYNACKNLWGSELRSQVIESGATLVVRPDSGKPSEVVLKVLQILSEQFGYTINTKGYKVLPNIRVLQGDGIDYFSIREILDNITNNGFSADNVLFGMGGALLQKVDRDTQRWAMKCSSACVNGEWVDVFKSPITDSVKVSKKGRVTLFKNLDNEYYSDVENGTQDELVSVFENGRLLVEYTFDEIRQNSQKVPNNQI